MLCCTWEVSIVLVDGPDSVGMCLEESAPMPNCCTPPAGYVQQLNMHSGLYSSLSRALSQYQQAAAQGGQQGQVRCAFVTAWLQCPQRMSAWCFINGPCKFPIVCRLHDTQHLAGRQKLCWSQRRSNWTLSTGAYT